MTRWNATTLRTSFAEAPETKGYVRLEPARSGLGPFQFRPLPTRPMVTRRLSLDGLGPSESLARVAAAIESTPDDAVVQLRLAGAVPPGLTAGVLRAMSGARNVTLAVDATRWRAGAQVGIGQGTPITWSRDSRKR